MRRFHQTYPAMRIGASHQPKTRIEMRAVARVRSTSSEALHASAATLRGLQAGLGGAGLAMGWMLRVIWENAVRLSRY